MKSPFKFLSSLVLRIRKYKARCELYSQGFCPKHNLKYREARSTELDYLASWQWNRVCDVCMAQSMSKFKSVEFENYSKAAERLQNARVLLGFQ